MKHQWGKEAMGIRQCECCLVVQIGNRLWLDRGGNETSIAAKGLRCPARFASAPIMVPEREAKESPHRLAHRETV